MLKELMISSFVSLLLFPLNLFAQDKLDDQFNKSWYELSMRGCLVGWYQNMLEGNDHREEQIKLGKQFCEAYGAAVVKKLNEP